MLRRRSEPANSATTPPPARLFAALLCADASVALACRAVAADPAADWLTHVAQTDSLYVEGRVTQYRVPVDKDATDPNNWVHRPEVCPTIEFKIWLRRPDFRIWSHLLPDKAFAGDLVEASWVDGRLRVIGGLTGPPARHSGLIAGASRIPALSITPLLTPLEYHFFDWGGDNAPFLMANRPHEAEGDALIFELSSEKTGAARWVGRVECTPALDYLPARMTLFIGTDAARAVGWDLVRLAHSETTPTPVMTKALMALHSPSTLPDERVVFLWEATRLEQRAITRHDLEVVFPDGLEVMDYTTNQTWIVGDPNSARSVAPERLKEIADALHAQMVTPTIMSERKAALRWIVAGATLVTLLIAALAYRLRRVRS